MDEATAHQLAIAAAMWLQGHNRAAARVLDRIPSGWRNARMPAEQVLLAVGDVEHNVHYRSQRDGSFTVDGDHLAVVHRWSPDDLDVEVDGVRRTVRVTLAGDPAGDLLHLTGAGTTTTFRVVPRFTVPGMEAPSGGLVAPMPGRVLEVRAAVGDTVTAGQTMLVLEAMKMEHHMTAPFDGTVTEVRLAENPSRRSVTRYSPAGRSALTEPSANERTCNGSSSALSNRTATSSRHSRVTITSRACRPASSP